MILNERMMLTMSRVKLHRKRERDQKKRLSVGRLRKREIHVPRLVSSRLLGIILWGSHYDLSVGTRIIVMMVRMCVDTYPVHIIMYHVVLFMSTAAVVTNDGTTWCHLTKWLPVFVVCPSCHIIMWWCVCCSYTWYMWWWIECFLGVNLLLCVFSSSSCCWLLFPFVSVVVCHM